VSDSETTTDTKRMHDVHSSRFSGGVDADGHIIEPKDLWLDYIDPKFRDRALHFEIDDDGLEQLVIDGKRPYLSSKGAVSTLGSMGATDLRAIQFDPARDYDTMAPFGSQDVGERLTLLDAENIDAAVIYTTVGLLWEMEVRDEALTMAHLEAYNRWITEWCGDSGGRLVASAHVSMSFPEASAREIERAVAAGAKGCFVAPFTHDRRPFGHPDHDPVFATCQELGIPFAIHPTFEPFSVKGDRMGKWDSVRKLRLLPMVTASDGVRQQFTAMFDFTVFDRFPDLKVLVLESGGSWLPYFMDRMDAVFEHTGIGASVKLANRPSDYLRERVWVSCDPDEKSIPHLVERFGDRFMWASDFPHPDHTAGYILDLDANAAGIPDAQRGRFLGANARELFDISG